MLSELLWNYWNLQRRLTKPISKKEEEEGTLEVLEGDVQNMWGRIVKIKTAYIEESKFSPLEEDKPSFPSNRSLSTMSIIL